MSLATRCPSCGTIFRVVQDQLKVCEGWVRCGQCDHVFNALEGLFDLSRDPPPDWSPSVPLPTAMASAPEPAVGANNPGKPREAERAKSTEVSAPSTPVAPAPHASHEIHDAPPAHRADVQAGYVAEEASAASTDESDVRRIDNPVDYPELPDSEVPDAAPEFVREAQRKARWDRPGVRAALATGAGVLVLAMVAQVGHQFRDSISAQWPALRPVFSAWCGAVGCKLEPPRRIEDISVESSALTRGDTPNSYQLMVALRNRGVMPLALPAIELSLTDASGQLLARRALSPRDFRAAPAATLVPRTEFNLQMIFRSGDSRVAGYTVEAFYP